MHMRRCLIERLSHQCSVVEGKSLCAAENELVGRFVVTGLKPWSSGIRVNFAINNSGIVEVCADSRFPAHSLKHVIGSQAVKMYRVCCQ